MMHFQRPVLFLAVVCGWLLAGCSGGSSSEKEWWKKSLASDETMVTAVHLKAGESRELQVDGTGSLRLGLLVREVDAIRQYCEQNRDSSTVIFLEQAATNRRVGTYFAAATAFDLSEGKQFKVYNRSPVATDVMIYRKAASR